MDCWRKNGVFFLRPRQADLSDPRGVTEVLEAALRDDGERNVIVDLSLADSLSSLQIGTLVTLHLLCYENLAVMKLANVAEKVKMVLRLIGLDKIMQYHHGAAVARESFGPERETYSKE